MHSSLIAVNEIIKLNTRLFINSLEGVEDKIASTRINDSTNSIIFIACHLLDARYYFARLVGIKAENPYKELFDQAENIDDMNEYPELEEIKSHWSDISNQIVEKMPNIKDTRLKRKSPLSLPVDDKTLLGTITFLVEHESYHIGQLGFLRKYFELDSMKY